MYVVLHYSHVVEPFFSGGRAEFIVIIKVNYIRVEAIETSIRGEFVGHSCYTVVGKLSELELFLLAVLPIIVVDTKVLLEYLDCLFTESIYLRVAGSREVELDIELSV